MKRSIATLAAAAVLVGGATLASSASARDSFSISIGGPGYAVGYSNRGYAPSYSGYYAPPVVYSAPAYGYDYGYSAPYYAPPVVVSPAVVYRAPYAVAYVGRPYYYGHRHRGYYR